MASKAEKVAEILHRDMVALRVGALPWDAQPEGYRATVAGSSTVSEILSAVLNEDNDG